MGPNWKRAHVVTVDNTNREAVLDDTAIIEARRNVLQEMPLEKLAEIFRIQEGKDPGAVVSVVNETDKKKVIDHIIENMVNNHHPVTKERYQFVLWLYTIRKQHGNRYRFLQPDFICIIFDKMIVMESYCQS